MTQREVYFADFRPNNTKPLQTFWIGYARFDWRAWWSTIPCLWMELHGHLASLEVRYMVKRTGHPAQNHVMKIEINIGVDLGIEPRSQYLLHACLNHSTTLLQSSIKQTKINIFNNQFQCCKTKTRAYYLNRPIACFHILSSSLKPAEKQIKQRGFLTPTIWKRKNSDQDSTLYKQGASMALCLSRSSDLNHRRWRF